MENQKGNLTIDKRHPDPDGDYISRLILPLIKKKWIQTPQRNAKQCIDTNSRKEGENQDTALR